MPSSSAERGSRPVLLFPHVRVRPQAGPALPLTRCAGRGGCERPGLGAGPVCPGPWSPSTSRGGAGVDLNAVFNVPLPAGARASGTGAPERLLSLTSAQQRCPHPQGPAPLGGRCSALQASVSALCPSWGPWAAGSGGEGLRAWRRRGAGRGRPGCELMAGRVLLLPGPHRGARSVVPSPSGSSRPEVPRQLLGPPPPRSRDSPLPVHLFVSGRFL